MAEFGFKKRRDTIKVVIPESKLRVVHIDSARFLVLTWGMIPLKGRRRRLSFFICSTRRLTIGKNFTVKNIELLRKDEERLGREKVQEMLDEGLRLGYFQMTSTSRRYQVDTKRWREIEFDYRKKSMEKKLQDALTERFL